MSRAGQRFNGCRAALRTEVGQQLGDECLRQEPSGWWQGLKAVKEAWYYSWYSPPDVAYEISNLISQRTIREHGGRPGLEQFVQKKLRPVSGVMNLSKE